MDIEYCPVCNFPMNYVMYPNCKPSHSMLEEYHWECAVDKRHTNNFSINITCLRCGRNNIFNHPSELEELKTCYYCHEFI